MLAQLGGTTFEVAPMNFHELSRDAAADFAEKAVMGRRPPLEFVGEGPETRTITCRLFPAKFGGLSSLEGLHKQRASGKAQPFMRGDGAALGWFVIERISERDSYIDAHGVGQIVEVDISIKRSDAAGLGAMFSIVSILI
ncbi:phage tail protein [Hyphomicrobium sulfonivorans]|uniref:phage tail protein n=1 Tax=Hyphomicrobium sulfonivorans TaxID=121290 RepID=UPI00156E4BB6|nr:phage tail protein [Hyphomicrobium sulfonivorans]MBI1649886.1 phage tail protein [Hyphomicrobium sulfonivorans]NSL71797.1 phage tail protein [Hyphomicrobium sulfonivorans]